MLASMLILLALIDSVFGAVSCYDCSLAPDKYNYIITPNNIPSEIQNCPTKVSQKGCTIDIRWDLTANMTGIDFITDEKSPLSLQKTLRVQTLLSGIGTTKEIKNILYYFCTTDRCNDISVFKRMLESLSVTNDLTKLEYLLIPNDPFNGRDCSFFVNITDGTCDSSGSIDPTTCKQCSTVSTSQASVNKICATCFKDNINGNYLGEDILFNMNDRSITSGWLIRCQSKDCNGMNTGLQIRTQSRISFDFKKFLDYNIASKQAISSSLISIAFLMSTLVIKTAY